jgi:hypothetical protein
MMGVLLKKIGCGLNTGMAVRAKKGGRHVSLDVAFIAWLFCFGNSL